MRLVFGEHELDLRLQELRRAGARVHIEPQVFDLLVHLIRNRDRVVSKDELFETIWKGRIVSEAALSSRINAARKAVCDDGDRQSLIKTVHRRGFRFVGAVIEAPDRAGAAGPAQSSGRGAGFPPEATGATPATAYAGERRPSLAVMPFTNLTRQP